MIEQQIRTWEVLDPVVLALLGEVPRENFVAASQAGLAFADIELPIGFGQTMLSPKLEGRILQALSVKKTDKVLLVGTGSGYLTALLASLTAHV
ncbi:MAG: protein-L-isoaspartate O-methyltransferase, partial [Methylotenera sp.]